MRNGFILNKQNSGIYHMSENWQTRMTLIQRAKTQDNELAWEEFVQYYQGFISMVVYKLYPGHSESQDIVQTVLLKVWKNLALFDETKKIKFRTWLNCLIRNCLIDYLRKHSKHKDNQAHVLTEDGKIPQSLEPRSEAEVDVIIGNEWKAHITRLALDAIPERFSGKTMQVFDMSMKNVSAEDISKELELTVESVYTLKNRVKKFLMRQIKELRHELEL